MSGNSGTEQFNINVSAPVKENAGRETLSILNKTLQFYKEAEEIKILDNIEEFNENIVEESTQNAKVENIEVLDETEEFKEEVIEDNTEILDNFEEVKEEVFETETTKELLQEENVIKSQELTVEELETKVLEVDTAEVVSGFEEARKVINDLYKTVFNKEFKPCLNDVVADLLAYLGVKAEECGKKADYYRAFNIDTSRFADRYRTFNYIPLCFKISVWADRNKGLNSSIEILNGLLRSLFALNVNFSESESVKTVSNLLSSLIKYLNEEGVETGF